LIEVEDIVSGNPHSAERQEHPALGTELEYHMGADIRGPDVVVGVNPYHVCHHEQVVVDAADEPAGRVEFHERMLAPMKDVDVMPRVHRHASRLHEVLAWRQLEESLNWCVGALGN
jgi:hypothetical protein